jgi:hypothetical protein
MVETLALVYYRAIHDATRSRVLRGICRQILHDEIAHIRFQYERLAIVHRRRGTIAYHLTLLAQQLLFFAVVLAVWAGHRRAFCAGGHSFHSYWKASWSKMRRAWRGMRPENYDWEK